MTNANLPNNERTRAAEYCPKIIGHKIKRDFVLSTGSRLKFYQNSARPLVYAESTRFLIASTAATFESVCIYDGRAASDNQFNAVFAFSNCLPAKRSCTGRRCPGKKSTVHAGVRLNASSNDSARKRCKNGAVTLVIMN